MCPQADVIFTPYSKSCADQQSETMIKSCQDFTKKITVVRRLIFAATALPSETPGYWEIVSSFATKLESGASDLTPMQAKLFFENLTYIEPEAIIPDQDLIKKLQAVVGPKTCRIGLVLISPNQTCLQCGSSLLVKADRPSIVTVYTDTFGTVSSTHYRKLCKKFRSGCHFVQHYGHYSTGGSSIYFNDNWKELTYFLSTRNTAVEMSLLAQLDAEVLVGQLSYKQRSEIYNIKHGYDKAMKKKDKDHEPSTSQQPE